MAWGKIKEIEEGHVFLSRADLSGAGVHRPLQAGICGGASEPAESVLLSGGYEDDADFGGVILYTGQGGNDLETKKQVYNQELTRGNRSLVRSLLEGSPVRVVRAAKHDSPYSPPVGFRYEGLYRVSDYWQESGKAGFRIWRFRLEKIGATDTASAASSRVRETDEGRERYAAAPRQEVTVARLVRSSPTANRVKRLHEYQCQICGEALQTPGGPYAEAAHIQPLGAPHNGPDVAENILCLCPNHHVLFDLGALTIEDDGRISGSENVLRRAKGHTINPAFLQYHRELYKQEQ